MSKRDRAARAKDVAEDSAGSAVDELDVSELTADDSDTGGSDSVTAELRPTGKRSGRGRHSAADASTADDDTDSQGGTAVAVKERKDKKKTSAAESRNPIVRIWLFLQQVVVELKKVIWPTKREIILYTVVVLVFVALMTAFVFGLDLAFAKGVLWLFG